MMQGARDTLPVEVDQVRGQFQTWRATRKPGSPTPPELWKAAVLLARRHGLYDVSRALPIDYGALKKRMAADGGDPGVPEFIEFTPVEPTNTLRTGEAGPVVELAAADGARMTIRLPAGDVLDLVGLVGAFRRRYP